MIEGGKGAMQIVGGIKLFTVLVEREGRTSVSRIRITECIPEDEFLDFERKLQKTGMAKFQASFDATTQKELLAVEDLFSC